MDTIFIYMVKVAVYLTAFYMVYSIMLSRDTYYSRNRAFILLSIALSMIFPFLTLQILKPLGNQFFGKLLSDVFINASGKTQEAGTESTVSNSMQIVYSIYFIGVIVLILKLLTDLLNLLFLIARQKKEGSRIIIFHGFNTAGFSAMGYTFINTRLSLKEAEDIIKHEQNHIKQKHFLDIVFIEIIKAFQWFNPVIYLFNRSLRAIHEYQADQECISSGIPVVNYQSLLLSQVFKSGAFNLTNSFSNPSLIKKRMIMMTKKRTSAFAGIKLLFVVPVVGIVYISLSAFGENTNSSQSQTKFVSAKQSSSENISEILPSPPPPPAATTEDQISESKEQPYVVVDEMPVFPGGDLELLKYIAQHTTYPDVAKVNNIEGRVIIRFCITSQGSISQVGVLKGVSPELDNEAIRVVNTLPAFKPGKQGGKAVPVWYMVPITFTLK
jgi:TonB family protein